jgi:hypothetical protein
MWMDAEDGGIKHDLWGVNTQSGNRYRRVDAATPQTSPNSARAGKDQSIGACPFACK